jgi:malate/lactate dehydrogenase
MLEYLPREIIQELGERYSTSESKKNWRMNEDLIKEIFSIIENKGYEIIESRPFPTEFFSATALSQFEEPIRQWVQSGQDYYIPVEQIIRDLISKGWVIKPPEGI